MYCNSCGCRMDENDRFCPACGAKNDTLHTSVYGSKDATREYHPDQTKEYAPVDSGAAANAAEDEDSHTMVLDGFNASYQEDFAEPFSPRRAYPPESYGPQPVQPRGYDDPFDRMSQAETGEYDWQDTAPSPYRQYRRTTAGRRVLSILMCLMMLLFGFFAMVIGSLRLGLTEDNIRKAYQKGTLADLRLETDQGEQSLGQIFMSNVVDAQTNLPITLDGKAVDAMLRTSFINNFTENLVVDFTQFFIFGEKPNLLNSSAIVGFLRSVGGELKEQIGYALSEADIEFIGKRIDGGDLSFLSIDGNGGYFKQKYGFNPYTIPSFFSVWALALCGGLALLCMIMIFVINYGNFPAGLSFNGTTMIVFGVINTLIAGGMMILSYLKNIFLLSDLLRNLAIAMGAISIVVLVVGIVFSIIKTILRNRIRY